MTSVSEQPLNQTTLHPLLAALRDVQCLIQRQLFLQAVARFVLLAIGWSAICVAVDFGTRMSPGVVQQLISLAWYLGLAAVAVHCFRRGTTRSDLLALARELEGHFPPLRHQLSSAAEFLLHPRVESGSASLKQLVIARTWQMAERQNLATAVNRHFASGHMAAAGVAIALLVCVALLFPQLAHTGISRLALPFSSDPPVWPCKHQLRVIDPPTAVERGEPVEFQIEDVGGKFPSDASFLVRTASNDVHEHPLTSIGPRTQFRLPGQTESIHYRVIGGDDQSMPWRLLQVVEPLGVSDWDIQLLPPKYVSEVPRPVQSPVTLIRGSQLIVRGNTSRPIHAVRLVGPADQRPVEGEVAGTSFRIPAAGATWIPTASATWTLEFTDASQAKIRERSLEVIVTEDQPPRLILTLPQEEGLVSPESQVRFAGKGEDDCGLAKIMSSWTVDDHATRTTTIELATIDSAAVATTVEFAAAVDDSRVPFAGSRIKVQVWSEDRCGQRSPVIERTLKIVASDVLQRELAAKLPEFVAILRDALTQMTSVQSRWREGDTPQIDDAVFQIERVQQQLLSPPAGLQHRLDDWLQIWRDHRLPDDQVFLAWRKMARELETDGRTLYRELLDTLRDHNAKKLNPAMIIARQREAVSQLERWLKEVAAQQDASRLAADLSELKQRQEKLLRQTTDEQLVWLTAAAEETHAVRTTFAGEQWDIARHWDRWLNRFVAIAGDDAAAARKSVLASVLRDAAKAIEGSRGQQAVSLQTEAVQLLGELMAKLPGSDSSTNPEVTAAWNRLQREIAELAKQQGELDAQWQTDLESNANRAAAGKQFAAQVRSLAAATQRLAESLNEVELRRVQSLLTSASQAMRSTALAVEREAWRDSLAQSLTASEELRSAANTLATIVRGAIESEQRQNLLRFVAQLQGIISRQEGLNLQTSQLHEEQTTQRALTRTMLATAAKLSQDQELLVAEVKNSIPPANASAMKLFLAEIEQHLTLASKSLTEQQFAKAVDHQTRGLAQLRTLMRVLTEEARSSNNDSADDPAKRDSQPNSGPARSAAELQLVLTLQREIGRRATALPGLEKSTQNDEQTVIANNQGELATVVESWGPESATPRKFTPPSTATAWQTIVEQELAAGEDLGAAKTAPFERLAYRMRIAESMLRLNQLAKFPHLQAAIEQDLEQFAQAASQQRQSSQQRKTTPAGSQSNQSGDPTGTTGSNSTQQSQKPAKVEFNRVEVIEVARHVWGHLPPKMREDLLQSAAEEFLPAYAAEIREYYRRLANERTARP